jgi:PAS domain S-box-containing protein
MKSKDSFPYKILIIEDNPGDILLIQDYLYEHILNPQFITSSSFNEAIQEIDHQNWNFDIILLDLSLPDKKGEHLIRELVDFCRQIPIVALTGYSDLTFSIKSLSLGVADYLMKDELTPATLYKSLIYAIERKKMAAELEESNKRYSDLFHLSPMPMWVFDWETLLILDANQAAIDHYGYERDEFLQLNIKQLRPESEIPALMQFVGEVKWENSDLRNSILLHQKKDGSTFHVETKSTKITFLGRKAKLVQANDISDRLEYIAAIEEQNKRLREISWTQSHVVRAPLSRIMGLVNLRKGMDSNDPDLSDEEFLNLLTQSAEELDQIIRKITENAAQIKLKQEKPGE